MSDNAKSSLDWLWEAYIEAIQIRDEQARKAYYDTFLRYNNKVRQALQEYERAASGRDS